MAFSLNTLLVGLSSQKASPHKGIQVTPLQNGLSSSEILVLLISKSFSSHITHSQNNLLQHWDSRFSSGEFTFVRDMLTCCCLRFCQDKIRPQVCSKAVIWNQSAVLLHGCSSKVNFSPCETPAGGTGRCQGCLSLTQQTVQPQEGDSTLQQGPWEVLGGGTEDTSLGGLLATSTTTALGHSIASTLSLPQGTQIRTTGIRGCSRRLKAGPWRFQVLM